jgi:glycosyltransferase involved in cell wall biosynthesis
MRICFVSHSAGSGGAERVLLETIELLERSGVECRVLLPSEGSFCRELTQLGVPYSIISYPMWMSRGKASFFTRLKAALNLIKDTPLVAWQILRWKCDVVYSNTATVCVGAFASRFLRRSHIWHLHEFGLEDQGLSFLFGERFSLALIDRLSTRCICVSHALAKKYARSLEPSKITVVYPSMHRALSDVENSRQPDAPVLPRTERFRCIIVGALIEGKGQRDAVLALAHLKKNGIAAELLVVGGGEPQYCHTLEELVQTNNLEKEVVFLGPVENARSLLQSSDVVLVCSKSEAFGRVTIEGMFAGQPVIGARSAATAELIKDGINGLLYNPGDPKDLASKIESVYQNPELGKRLGGNAKMWIDGYFTPRRYTEDVLTILGSTNQSIAVRKGLARLA